MRSTSRRRRQPDGRRAFRIRGRVPPNAKRQVAPRHEGVLDPVYQHLRPQHQQAVRQQDVQAICTDDGSAGIKGLVTEGIKQAIAKHSDIDEVVGANRIDYIKVYDIALSQQNRSMAAVDLDGVRADLLKYGWIKDARVSRRLPETLVINVDERSPAAVWQHNQRLSLIDANGVVLEGVTAATMPDLPLLIGPGANQRSRDLDVLLADSRSLKPLLAGATWVGNRRWDLRFDSGETLSLPMGEAAAKRALARFTHMEGSNRLLGRGIVRFDMRDPAKFVLRMPPEGQVNATENSTDTAEAEAAMASDTEA
ncbi:MAG: FtsQ-type POTRA domain-containing protein [Sphingopyxis sp.]|nr:FtsQ-type POTRA domain-containing protein [Sphingopyxis sp.]